MKVTCLQENLARGLSIVGRAVSTRSTLPVLGNVLLETDNGRLKLSATNLEIVMTCWIGAKVNTEGSITVPARTLGDLVNALPQEQVELTLLGDEKTLHVACSRTEANIKGLPAAEFPVTPKTGEDPHIRLDPQELKEMISQVVFAAATDDARPVLTGVSTSFENDEVVMAATDGFRLSVRSIKLGAYDQKPRRLIIPGRALTELARVIGDADEFVDVIMPEGRNQVIFELDSVRMVAQLIDGNFPDYGAVIPKRYNTRTVLNTASFLKACKTANIFAREASNTATVSITPDSELMPGYATVSATSAETGDNVAQIDAAVDGKEVELRFNVKFITDVLQVINTPQVALETTSAVEPGVVKPVGKDDFVHIIMPMQFGA